MLKRIFKFLLLVLFIAQVFSGCTWFSEEEKYRDGFDESNLAVPQVPSYDPFDTIEKPDENESQLPPGFSYNLNWAMGDIYAYWGGFVNIKCENIGSNDIFVHRYGIVVNWSFPDEWIYEEKYILIPAGKQKNLGIVYFHAPGDTGNFSYHIIMSILVKDNELFDEYNVESWYDNGTIHSKENTLIVKPLGMEKDVKTIHNYGYYYDKLNKRVTFDDPRVQSIVSDIKEDYAGTYNIYQVLEAFNYIINNLSYISDPEGRDYWCYPSETVDRGGGDCEDFSILFSSLVGALGGTTRIYLTQTHAFSVLYVGNKSQKNELLDAINLYYNTEHNFVLFEDEESYWLAADPAGSLYMGGLPADAEPAMATIGFSDYGFNFLNTTKIHILDIVG